MFNLILHISEGVSKILDCLIAVLISLSHDKVFDLVGLITELLLKLLADNLEDSVVNFVLRSSHDVIMSLIIVLNLFSDFLNQKSF
jgi:hypothetical protein